MSYDEAALERIEGVLGNPEFIPNFPDKHRNAWRDSTSPTILDPLDLRLLRIIRELDH